MIVEWNENPLKTTFVLDGYDLEILRLKIVINQLKDAVLYAGFSLERGSDLYNVDEAVRWLDILNEQGNLKEQFGYCFENILHELEDGEHMGDCVCIACSCFKCEAEDTLGFDTIVGLGKHEAAAIHGEFNGGVSIDEVLERLTHPPEFSGTMSRKMFDEHVDRWTQERLNAHKWLSKYKADHF